MSVGFRSSSPLLHHLYWNYLSSINQLLLFHAGHDDSIRAHLGTSGMLESCMPPSFPMASCILHVFCRKSLLFKPGSVLYSMRATSSSAAFKGTCSLCIHPIKDCLLRPFKDWSRAATDPFLLELCGEAGRHGPARVTNNTQEHRTVHHTSQHPNGRKMDSYLSRLFYWKGSWMV